MQIEVKEILDKYSIEIASETYSEFICLCPFHEDKTPSFSINKTTGLWYCFTCAALGLESGSGNLIKFIMLLDECSYEKAKKIIYKEEDIKTISVRLLNKIDSAVHKEKDIIIKDIETKIELPREFELLDNIKQCPKYLLERLHWKTILHFKLGICREGYFKNRIIIPIYYNNEIVSFQARWIGNADDAEVKRYLFASGFDTKSFLFNYDNVKNSKIILLTEGSLNAMSLWEKDFDAVSCFSARELSSKQLKLLVNIKLDELVICFDTDKNKVGQTAAKRNMKKLRNYFNTSIMTLPLEKDPNDLNKEQLVSAYNSRSYEKRISWLKSLIMANSLEE